MKFRSSNSDLGVYIGLPILALKRKEVVSKPLPEEQETKVKE